MLVLNAIDSVLILLIEMIFGVLAVLTQVTVALNSNKSNIEIFYAITWAVEVLVAVSSFFLLLLFSTTRFAITGCFVLVSVLLGILALHIYKLSEVNDTI